MTRQRGQFQILVDRDEQGIDFYKMDERVDSNPQLIRSYATNLTNTRLKHVGFCEEEKVVIGGSD